MPFEQAYPVAYSFFTDPPAVFERLREFNEEVLTRMARTGDSESRAVEAVLELWERHGFKKSINLSGGIKSSTEWSKMLRNGALFNDNSFKASDNVHGSRSHRVQWHLLMRDMEARPQAYEDARGTPLASDLYKMIGSDELSAGTSEELWDFLFDSAKSDFTSPFFVQSTKGLWGVAGTWN